MVQEVEEVQAHVPQEVVEVVLHAAGEVVVVMDHQKKGRWWRRWTPMHWRRRWRWRST